MLQAWDAVMRVCVCVCVCGFLQRNVENTRDKTTTLYNITELNYTHMQITFLINIHLLTIKIKNKKNVGLHYK